MAAAETPRIKVPIGYELVEADNGDLEVRQRAEGERLRKTIAIRVSGSEYADLMLLVESFPERQFGAAIRWLLADQRVREVIAERIQAQTRRRGP